MLKLRKIFTIIFSFIFIIFGLCFSGLVEATEPETSERADMSNITFEWTGYDDLNHCTLHLNVKNVTLIKDNSYRVHISHNKDEKLNVTDYISLDNNVWNKRVLMDDSNTIHDLQDIVAEKGDIYIWICELDSNLTPKIVVEAKKVERLEQLPLGKRLNLCSFEEFTDIFCWEPQGKENRKVNLKIGLVTDKNILQAIKNRETNSLQQLLTYAKSADTVYNKTLPLDISRNPSIFDSADFTDNKYYYAYLELDDEDGKYYPVEDVCVYKYHDRYFYRCLDDSFIWDLENDMNETNKSGDNTTAKGILPKAGLEYVIISIVLILIVVVAITGIKIKRYKNIK